MTHPKFILALSGSDHIQYPFLLLEFALLLALGSLAYLFDNRVLGFGTAAVSVLNRLKTVKSSNLAGFSSPFDMSGYPVGNQDASMKLEDQLAAKERKVSLRTTLLLGALFFCIFTAQGSSALLGTDGRRSGLKLR